MQQLRFVCSYCKEPYRQFGRFTILTNRTPNGKEPLRSDQDDDDTVLSFCLPECACAYNYHMSNDPEGDHCQMRHHLLEQVCGRTIKNTPPRNMLKSYGNPDGVLRSEWLVMCRKNLTVEDAETAIKELSNVL